MPEMVKDIVFVVCLVFFSLLFYHIFRLIQYTSRLVWHQLEIRNANKYSVDRIKNLELTFSSFRKSKYKYLITLFFVLLQWKILNTYKKSSNFVKYNKSRN